MASGGELTMALTAGFDPAKIYMHSGNKTDVELGLAGRAGVSHRSSTHSADRALRRVLVKDQDDLIRVTPGIKPSTHSFIQTGQLDSKFGFGLGTRTVPPARKAIERVLASDRLNTVGPLPHRIADLKSSPSALAVEALGELRGDWCQVLDLGGGLGISDDERDSPPDRGVRESQGSGGQGRLRKSEDPDQSGRSLVGTAGVTIYNGGTVKADSRRSHIRGGRRRDVDNLRPMLYDAKYSAVIAGRPDDAADTTVTVAGSHCRVRRYPDP